MAAFVRMGSASRTLDAHGVSKLLTILVIAVAFGVLLPVAAVLAPAAHAGPTASPLPVVRSFSTGTGGSPDASAADPYAIVRTTTVGSVPTAIAYDASKGELFVANSNSNNVSVIKDSTGTVNASIPVGTGPSALAVDSGKGEVFVANTDSVSVISDSTNAVIATIPDAGGPVGLAYDSGKGEIFVADGGANRVSVIADSNNTIVATVNVGQLPMGLAYDSGTGEIFVSNFNSNTVSVISDASNTVVATVMVGLAPGALAYDSGQGAVYVTNFNSSTVSIISSSTHMVTGTISVGAHPWGVEYSAALGQLFVVNAGSANASVISDSSRSVIASVNLFYGGAPWGVAYDAGNGGWYICDITLGAVLIVANGYTVSFTETGLPNSMMWLQWINGTTAFGAVRTSFASTLSTSNIALVPGTYTYAVAASVRGYQANPASGAITVSSGGLTVAITFSKLYTATFTETGLPPGTNWTVAVAGTSKTSSTTTISFAVINGTYNFTADAGSGYSATPASGRVTVSGSDASQAVSFAVAAQGGLGSLATYAILGVVVVVAAVVALILVRRRSRKQPPGQGESPSGNLPP